MKITITQIESIHLWITDLKEFQLDSYFETNILGRSYDLIDKVKVIVMSDTSQEATINGSKLYTVSFILDKNTIFGTCTCPYHANCKHLAAVILNIKKIQF